MAKVIEGVEARYEVQEVDFGKVYKWRPERVVVECRCGERLSLGASRTTCADCGSDHMEVIQEESAGSRQSDEVLHPWRYSEDHEEGLPFKGSASQALWIGVRNMRSQDVRIGLPVRVSELHRRPDFRGQTGVVQQRYGDAAYDVRFRDGRSELFWHYELQEAREFYQQPG